MADIVETAVKAGLFNTLVKAVKAADLVEFLKSPGPHTLFAPIDNAFERLPEGALDRLLEDIPKLKKILTYHLVPGDVRAEDLIEIDEAETVEGSIIAVDTTKGYKVNEAVVIQPDILTDNGVIHVIDSVLMPGIMSN